MQANNKEREEAAFAYGRQQAQKLRKQAPELNDTDLIEQELFIPYWVEGQYQAGNPVSFEGQIYRTLQTHDSTGNPTWTPAATPALFGVTHTTNPAKAKPWKEPLGISGVYRKDECYADSAHVVWQQIWDGDNVYDAATIPDRWIAAGTLKDNVFVPYF